jgi:hypothetical protein
VLAVFSVAACRSPATRPPAESTVQRVPVTAAATPTPVAPPLPAMDCVGPAGTVIAFPDGVADPAAGVAYLADPEGGPLMAIRLTDGATLWTAPPERPLGVTSGRLIALDPSPLQLDELDPANGTRVFTTASFGVADARVLEICPTPIADPPGGRAELYWQVLLPPARSGVAPEPPMPGGPVPPSGVAVIDLASGAVEDHPGALIAHPSDAPLPPQSAPFLPVGIASYSSVVTEDHEHVAVPWELSGTFGCKVLTIADGLPIHPGLVPLLPTAATVVGHHLYLVQSEDAPDPDPGPSPGPTATGVPPPPNPSSRVHSWVDRLYDWDLSAARVAWSVTIGQGSESAPIPLE